MNKEVIGLNVEIKTPKSFEDYWRQAQISFNALLGEFEGDVSKMWDYVGEIEAINFDDYYNQIADRAEEDPSRENLLLVDMMLNTLHTATKETKIRHMLPHACRRSSLSIKKDIFPHRMARFFHDAELKVLDMGIDTREGAPFLKLEKILVE